MLIKIHELKELIKETLEQDKQNNLKQGAIQLGQFIYKNRFKKGLPPLNKLAVIMIAKNIKGFPNDYISLVADAYIQAVNDAAIKARKEKFNIK